MPALRADRVMARNERAAIAVNLGGTAEVTVYAFVPRKSRVFRDKGVFLFPELNGKEETYD